MSWTCAPRLCSSGSGRLCCTVTAPTLPSTPVSSQRTETLPRRRCVALGILVAAYTPGSRVHAHACCCLFLVAGGAAVHQVWCCGQGARPVSGRHSGIRVSAPRAVLRTIHGTPRHGPGHSCAELPSQPRGPVDRAVRGGDPPAVRRCPAASRCCGHAASARIRNRWRQAHHHVRGAGVASVQ